MSTILISRRPSNVKAIKEKKEKKLKKEKENLNIRIVDKKQNTLFDSF